MATVTSDIAAPPDRVFDVLADGWLYAVWVVGASQIRAVSAGWPAVGAKIHHSVGAWPAVLNDETEVLESERPERLVLKTKGRPIGTAVVRLTLRPSTRGTIVTMEEEPTGGPGSWLHNPLTDAILRLRNVETLQRLTAIAENRHQP